MIEVPGRAEPLIFSELPDLARAVPWRPLAAVPTPVEPCGPSALLGRDDLWMKRDDLICPVYGGNKIRRYEYVLADAEARGARRLVTVGGFASTQVTATVMLGEALGLGVTAVLFDQPVTSFARRALLADASHGGALVFGGGYVVTAVRTVMAYRRAERPYLILPGASHPAALLGYVDAMLELGEQVRRGELPRPDVIVVPAGSGGTLAALVVGASILRWPTLVVGVRITDLIACNRLTISLLAGSIARFLRRRSGLSSRLTLEGARFAIHHGAVGPGYGHPTPEAALAIPEVERMIGVPGEVTYSGKGLTGLRAVAADHPGKTILYWHTLSSVLPSIAGDAAAPPAFAGLFEGRVPI